MKVENGELRAENGELRVENGELRVENGEMNLEGLTNRMGGKSENWKTFSFQLSPFSCIIQLEMGEYDYSLSEIARIVEENDAKILGLTVDTIPEDPGRIVVSLLINQAECTAIVKSFYRYNYTILNTFSSPDENTDLRDRYSLLMRYLNV